MSSPIDPLSRTRENHVPGSLPFLNMASNHTSSTKLSPNSITNSPSSPNMNSNSTNLHNHDFIDTTNYDQLSAIDLFDPLRRPNQSPAMSSIEFEELFMGTQSVSTTTDDAITFTPLSSLYPIKLKLKLGACSEMKPFTLLTQRIRNEQQSNELSNDEIYYSPRIRRFNSQNNDEMQLTVTLHIFMNSSKEVIRLTDISLQSKVSHILKQLHEKISFNYNESILKLRTCEEYLNNDDVLGDIEYVYNCINSLRQIQFILVNKPTCKAKQKQENISFVEFCMNYQKKHPPISNQKTLDLSPRAATKSKQFSKIIENHSYLPYDDVWLNEFYRYTNSILQQIERCFNRLMNPLSKLEQDKLIQNLLDSSENLKIKLSDIQSPLIMANKSKLISYINQKIKDESENLIILLHDFLISIVKYIQAYCEAFLIPYNVEIYDAENKLIGIDGLENKTSFTVTEPQSIIKSSDLFSVRIDGLYLLPPNITKVRIIAYLCYGNEIKAKQTTRWITSVPNKHHGNSSEVHFDHQLVFDNAYLCGFQRETIIIFEIYSSSLDDTSENTPMHLIGWCSQSLFDHQNNLIDGECYLGIIDATITKPIGFYSLRNLSDHNCCILAVSFLNKKYFWPNVESRDDKHGAKVIEMNQEKQRYLNQLLKRPCFILNDHSVMITNASTIESSKQQISNNLLDENRELSDEERHILWSDRHFIINKPNSLPKLFKSRTVWDYPSLIDIYDFLRKIKNVRQINETESLELLLPTFPDMYIRTFAYCSLISCSNNDDLLLYLPQLLQIIKFDYDFSSINIEYLLKQCTVNHQLAHRLYWHLRQLLLNENVHIVRYYYLFLALLYVLDENYQNELENQYKLCQLLRTLGTELKNNKINRGYYLFEQLKMLNTEFFQCGQQTCRLPCRFTYVTNNIDINACSIFHSLTSPMKIVFKPIDLLCEKYNTIYKIGDDLRQDQIVVQLLSCMDKIWKSNNIDFRLSLFNVVPTQERCGFIEMISESQTLMEIEKPLGKIIGTFSESALCNWLHSHNTRERDFRTAIENLTYSCAGYCVATYVLGIGDRHNENIMVRKSGHLFHIDFGKYLGDTQKFGWFNRDRAPFIFTKQMLYAMSDGDTTSDAMHRFIDICCHAFCTLREDSSLLLLFLSHLCSSNIPNLNYDAVRFVYDRLWLSLNYAESITKFTDLIVDSLNSTWTTWNGLIHKMAQPTTSKNKPLSFIPNVYTVTTSGKIFSAKIINWERRPQQSKYYLYKIEVESTDRTYHYRTYPEFCEFYEYLHKQYPIIKFDFGNSRQSEDDNVARMRSSRLNEFLRLLLSSSHEIIESDVVCTFFYTIPRDQEINYFKEETNEYQATNNQPKISVQLKYEDGKFFVMIRHAMNLPLINGNEPKPYCKCYLMPDELKLTKQKGKIANSRNPIFNDMFAYEMTVSEIEKRLLRVSVWNRVLNPVKHVLGEVDIALSNIDLSKLHAFDYILRSTLT